MKPLTAFRCVGLSGLALLVAVPLASNSLTPAVLRRAVQTEEAQQSLAELAAAIS